MNTDIPHYIWAKNMEESDAHYEACRTLQVPVVTLGPDGKKYAHVSFDTYSMATEEADEKRLHDNILKFYRSYAELFGLPTSKFEYLGYGCRIKTEHADFIAEGLYHLLLTIKIEIKSDDDMVAVLMKSHHKKENV